MMAHGWTWIGHGFFGILGTKKIKNYQIQNFFNQNKKSLYFCLGNCPHMVIISKTILKNFSLDHPDGIGALNDWYALVKDADWSNLSDIRQDFNSVDYVGNDRYVFNIRGNRYRLIVMIFFDIRTVYIRFLGTHVQYDKIDASVI